MELVYKFACEFQTELIISLSVLVGGITKFTIGKFLADREDSADIISVKRNLSFVIGVSAFIACLVIISFFTITDFPVTGEQDKSQLGQFGDYIGGTLNPVLSFAALLALLINIHLQVKEFVKTRVEIASSANSQAELVFQSEFFSLLSSLEKQIDKFYEDRKSVV